MKHRHRVMILAVFILLCLNLIWWVVQFRPFNEIRFSDTLINEALTEDSLKSGEKIKEIDFQYTVHNQSVIVFKKFFTFIDSLASVSLPSNLGIPGDLVLIGANGWILDTLRRTDYRESLKLGRYIDDLKTQTIIPAGAPIRIPDSLEALDIAAKIRSTKLVMNIPEFRLRLIRNNDTILTAPVRVGRNESVFLEAVGHEVDLRTPAGKGKINRVWRTPKSVNLHTGEVYKVTRRDDGRVTKMPPIPSLEPVINGHRTGKMIHATTNPVTLGKAFSHGCVGVSEADMWTIYFNLPVGAEVEFRYDLKVGDTTYRDIYKRGY